MRVYLILKIFSAYSGGQIPSYNIYSICTVKKSEEISHKKSNIA
jgi:hypothetical protein